MGNGIFGDLFAPVGALTAQGRQAIAEEQKRKALEAMQNSPVATKYAGRPEVVGGNGGGIRDTLMNGVDSGRAAYDQARQSAAPPVYDGTLPAMGGMQNNPIMSQDPNAVNPSPDIGGFIKRMWDNAPKASDVLGGWPQAGSSPAVPAAAMPRGTPLPEVNRNYQGQGQGVGAMPTPMQPAQPKSLADQIEEYRQIVEAVTPKPDTSLTPSEQKAKDYQSHQLDRTKLMAQLAISSGLTAQAGYPDVARGFAAAGSVYDHGFDRYAAALNDSADRELAKRSEAYKGEVGKSNAAITLYSENAKIGRDLVEQRRKENIAFLLAGKPPGELATTDPEAYNAAYDKWYREYGQYQTTGDMPAFDGDVRDSKQ